MRRMTFAGKVVISLIFSADFTIMAVLLHRLDSFSLRAYKPVSYTHLDVYKRQQKEKLLKTSGYCQTKTWGAILLPLVSYIPVSYTHLRVFPLFHTRFISVNDDFDTQKLKGDTGGMEVAFKYLISEYYSRDTVSYTHLSGS